MDIVIHWGSWGLSLFVLFEPNPVNPFLGLCSWGLSLFVLFERKAYEKQQELGSWGLSLFVLFEQHSKITTMELVLED